MQCFHLEIHSATTRLQMKDLEKNVALVTSYQGHKRKKEVLKEGEKVKPSEI